MLRRLRPCRRARAQAGTPSGNARGLSHTLTYIAAIPSAAGSFAAEGGTGSGAMAAAARHPQIVDQRCIQRAWLRQVDEALGGAHQLPAKAREVLGHDTRARQRRLIRSRGWRDLPSGALCGVAFSSNAAVDFSSRGASSRARTRGRCRGAYQRCKLEPVLKPVSAF
jgi:hypothetical protein